MVLGSRGVLSMRRGMGIPLHSYKFFHLMGKDQRNRPQCIQNVLLGAQWRGESQPCFVCPSEDNQDNLSPPKLLSGNTPADAPLYCLRSYFQMASSIRRLVSVNSNFLSICKIFYEKKSIPPDFKQEKKLQISISPRITYVILYFLVQREILNWILTNQLLVCFLPISRIM